MASLDKSKKNRQRSRTRVRLRFYEELNDFLPPHRRKTEFERDLPEPTTTKDLIEGCRVPHTEVDLILVNGEPVTFDHLIEDGDRVSIYPVFESLDISGSTRLQERPPEAAD
ncbi:MoaD/ThiS family protein [Natronogracilivirga saccharolytica]|uniref:MoaD/ThiS family protein n=1 Tax=Natronogracilivirga saccharolytica TaxID=2812953 RepID=A0A8J7UUD3_9BACT|nr:MoaD/ThiS family protein [Natronogracilivirga saccharolytica]MBP3192305.1 MoaD/ThiS family protein [Natronogracilivirga saccharolytica]